MSNRLNFEKIDPTAAVLAVNATLRRIDERLADHGERVAYIACQLNKYGQFGLNEKELFLLSAFHDIGAYKTEEIDNMLEFETKCSFSHSVYGYLFLKYLTPLSNCAKAILYHHSSWDTIKKEDFDFGKYAAMIHIADRIDVAFNYSNKLDDIILMTKYSASIFNLEYFNIAILSLNNGEIIPSLLDGTYHEKNIEVCTSFKSSTKEALEYLKMVVYSIDFRSEHTVTHTINTVAIALNISRHFNLDKDEIQNIYLGALLHDIGKIAIPISILEFPGRLSDEDMEIMRTHVDETESLINGIVPDNICKLALRHHEKLDGSGYPKHLMKEQITFSQRIVAVADIVSALSSRRSYKEPFPKDKTISILTQMSESQLDPVICNYVIDNYDIIMESTDVSRREIIDKYKYIKQEYDSMTNVKN